MRSTQLFMTSADLRDKTLEVRKQHVLAAAFRVFSEHGFRRATIQQIAKEAGIAAGTIHNVFEGKFDILVALLDPLAERALSPDLPPGPGRNASDVLARLQRRLSVFDHDTLAMMRVLIAEALVDPEVREMFGRQIIKPMTGRQQNAKTNGTAYLSVAAILGLVMLRLLGESDADGEGQALSQLARQFPRAARKGTK